MRIETPNVFRFYHFLLTENLVTKMQSNTNTHTPAPTSSPATRSPRSRTWYLIYFTGARIMLVASAVMAPLYLWPLLHAVLAQNMGEFLWMSVLATATVWGHFDLRNQIRRWTTQARTDLGYVPSLLRRTTTVTA